jgi:hypothetical protein
VTPPLGTIKDQATDTLKTGIKLPVRAAARAYGVAKGATSIGVRVARESRQAPQSPQSPWDEAIATEPTPVNVVEQLGLDPAPVDTSHAPKPITSIDAQADPGQVEATPADVAARLARPDGR